MTGLVPNRWALAAIALLLACGGASAEVRAQASPPRTGDRPAIGVALGGGSAKGLAHVGVLQWLERHRVPIDLIAGTSMGGLIGGSYATGMSPEEIEDMLARVDWDAMFGSANFQFQNVRRKRDSRAYPSHLEFGLGRGIVPPTSLNTGQQVDLLLARITFPYYAIGSFDELPTPFRTVAVDLTTARFVVLDRGPLGRAMRATMSLPLIFPPVQADGQVLVDGGAMNNVPADVTRAMGADKVIAVNVGSLDDRANINRSLLGLVGETLDAMMRANTRRAMEGADIVINVPLADYGSLDWRRSAELVRAGYDAAEAMRADLLPLAVDEAAWQAWRSARAAARRTAPPVPTFVDIQGAARSDADLMRRVLEPHVGRPLDPGALEADLTRLGGLDRYQTLNWSLVNRNGADGLLVDAQPKGYGPPFVYLGFSLENTTGNDFRFGLSGRYLAFDVLGSGSELRLDAAIGSDPSAAVALYRPLGRTPIFVEPVAGVAAKSTHLIEDGEIVAAYRQTRTLLGADVGVNVSRLDEVRVGVRFGRLDASREVGDPGLAELGGRDARVHLWWTHDGQDSVVVPSTGIHAIARIEHFLDAPEPPVELETEARTAGATQAEVKLTWFGSLDGARRHRWFAAGGGGTSFDRHPQRPEQFPLGGPFRLGAFNVGERRGNHYLLATAGYLYRLGRLPDFLGGPVFAGGWLETGAAFDRWADAEGAVHASTGIVLDTLIGPVFAGSSAGFDGRWRVYLAIGHIFR